MVSDILLSYLSSIYCFSGPMRSGFFSLSEQEILDYQPHKTSVAEGEEAVQNESTVESASEGNSKQSPPERPSEFTGINFFIITWYRNF